MGTDKGLNALKAVALLTAGESGGGIHGAAGQILSARLTYRAISLKRQTKHVEVRLVSATNRDPAAEVRAGRLREDLFYRLNVLPIRLPPLRDRIEDILPLAKSFLRRYAREEGRALQTFDAEAERVLLSARWPGNVRQLENAIRRIAVLYDGALVTKAMLPPDLATESGGPTASGAAPSLQAIAQSASVVPFWRQEQAIIESALAAFAGNTQRAAAALEISPSTIYRKRQSWPGGDTSGA